MDEVNYNWCIGKLMITVKASAFRILSTYDSDRFPPKWKMGILIFLNCRMRLNLNMLLLMNLILGQDRLIVSIRFLPIIEWLNHFGKLPITKGFLRSNKLVLFSQVPGTKNASFDEGLLFFPKTASQGYLEF